MITREEALKILKKKEQAQNKKVKETINNVLERISNSIRRGQFYLPNVGNNPVVHENVKKAMAREGFSVEFFKTETRLKRKDGKRSKEYMTTNMRVTVNEEE